MTIVTKSLVQAKMPPGYMSQRYKEKSSTNQLAREAVRHISSPEDFTPCWITAQTQTAGRGTRGRHWLSQGDGNLYTSLLLYPDCADKFLSQLSLIAGIALYDTIVDLGAVEPTILLLKWPNDLMVGTAKLAGILVETQRNISFDGCFAVIGTGVNITTAPRVPDRATTCLKDWGDNPSAGEVLQSLAITTDHWLKRWDRGNDFHQIASAWVLRAQIIGRIIVVLGAEKKPLQGICRGVDERARLIIELENGSRSTIEFNRIEQITLSGR